MLNFKNKAMDLVCIAITGFLTSLKAQEKPTVWKFINVNKVGNSRSIIQGKPSVTKSGKVTAISFNGIGDGLIISENPLDSWSCFTIEVLFKPDGKGPKEPRFVHFEDRDKNRGTLELRLTSSGQWYLDAFLKNGKLNKGITLIDSTQLHQANRWYWVAMVYDGEKMISYVNGVKQLENLMNFPPMNGGQIAFGMRLNKVSWFKGLVGEARFYHEALPPALLQSVRQ
jgi:hypothetical protein